MKKISKTVAARSLKTIAEKRFPSFQCNCPLNGNNQEPDKVFKHLLKASVCLHPYSKEGKCKNKTECPIMITAQQLVDDMTEATTPIKEV